MFGDLSKELKKIILAGIGAVAVTAEKGEEVIKELIKRGELTVEQGKALNEELKRNSCKPDASCKESDSKNKSFRLDVDKMTKEERSELKRCLEELEENEKNGQN